MKKGKFKLLITIFILFVFVDLSFAMKVSKYRDTIINRQGKPTKATIAVYESGLVGLATIYSDRGTTPKANPFTTDAYGQFEFYADAGKFYDIRVSGTGIRTYTVFDVALEVIGIYEDVRNYASFSAAITDIDTDEAVLLIPDEQAVTDNKTVPANVTLKFLQGGSLNISAAKTVTINGHVDAGLYQIFSGDGSVSFGSGSVKEVSPQWWGAVGDDSTNCRTAIQSAIDSLLNGGVVRITEGTWVIDGKDARNVIIVLKDGVSIIGEGQTSIIKIGDSNFPYYALSSYDVTSDYGIDSTPIYNIKFADFAVDCNASGNPIGGGGDGPSRVIWVVKGSDVVIDNLRVDDCNLRNVFFLGTSMGDDSVALERGRISNNRIYDVSTDTDSTDHSSVYFCVDSGEIYGNIFENADPATHAKKISCAIENHGRNVSIFGNQVYNYHKLGFQVAGGIDAYNVSWFGNHAENVTNGISIWTASQDHQNIEIVNNTVILEDNEYDDTMRFIACSLVSGTVLVDGLKIEGNIVKSAGTAGDARKIAGVYLYLVGIASNVSINGNHFYDMDGQSIHVTGNQIFNLEIKDNVLHDPNRKSFTGYNDSGIYVAFGGDGVGNSRNVQIVGNLLDNNNNGNSNTLYGIVTMISYEDMADVLIRDNIVNMAGTCKEFCHVLNAGTFTRLYHEIRGAAAPTAGRWTVGNICWNTAPAASGTMGWVCTTEGVAGTWKTFGTIEN